MIAGLFSAIKAVFGAGERPDDVERFRARARLRSRQQRAAAKQREEEPESPRRRKAARNKGRLRPLASSQPYTASTFQSYCAPGEEPAPDSPLVHEHQVLMLNAFDFSASPEAFLYEDDDAAMYGDYHLPTPPPSSETQSIWRRRFHSDASSGEPDEAGRRSPKLGADALWESHFSANAAAVSKLNAVYFPSDTRGLYYD